MFGTTHNCQDKVKDTFSCSEIGQPRVQMKSFKGQLWGHNGMCFSTEIFNPKLFALICIFVGSEASTLDSILH